MRMAVRVVDEIAAEPRKLGDDVRKREPRCSSAPVQATHAALGAVLVTTPNAG